jgi:MYXO-CTERM domain-containing protein
LWLLTDGTVLSHGNGLSHWVILTPDSTGSYAKGTWKTVATSAFARDDATEHVLKDGRFFEAGGEYIYSWPAHDGVAACASSCAQPPDGSPLFKNVEIYDPVANTWTIEPDGLYDIGDTGSATLSDGRLLYSTRAGSQTEIYDPSMNTWTAGLKSPLSTGDENAWASLQNGGVLAVGYATDGAAIYDPATNTWVRTGAVPAGFNTGDTAGISQLFDGRVIAYGLGQTYIYTPGAAAADPGTWALGPTMLNGDEAEDSFSDTLPNGQAWVTLTTVTYGPLVALQAFDPTTNTVASVTPPPDPSQPYPLSFVNLPNGQVMITGGSQDWLYTPDTAPEDAWRPTVTSVAFNSGSTYTLTGSQLSGLINGGDNGDDMTMAENYPIVWLTDNANHVYYCRSFNFSNMMPSLGSTPETCQFTTPAGLAAGSYDLFVSAVGVQSKVAFPFTTSTSTSVDAGSSTPDAGTGTDAAAGVDATVGLDAASSADVGTTDATTGSDAGDGSNDASDAAITSSDGNVASGSDASTGLDGAAGPGLDSGQGATTEAGSVASDAATTSSDGAAGDSGVRDDVGNPSGCGCRTVSDSSRQGSPMALSGLLGLAVIARRRRRRHGNFRMKKLGIVRP